MEENEQDEAKNSVPDKPKSAQDQLKDEMDRYYWETGNGESKQRHRTIKMTGKVGNAGDAVYRILASTPKTEEDARFRELILEQFRELPEDELKAHQEKLRIEEESRLKERESRLTGRDLIVHRRMVEIWKTHPPRPEDGFWESVARDRKLLSEYEGRMNASQRSLEKYAELMEEDMQGK